ncbi:AMP-binding protein [Amycolatopsis pithecellobii]|uniref:AMP-binding protein n=1 Tax=Amycolatopsis pithecellobii TaxID=664692 RepID=A0A6N7YYT4_9PSEU|nr:AMP-binding protein [Amycolatopsis pithecellobii]MTD57058.1 AMP-binding protein [Amycolatopsis pithecellobii]
MVDVVGSRTLNDLLDEREASDGQRTACTIEALSGERVELTYAELASTTRRLAGGFSRAGIGKGDAVLVHLPNCVELVLSWFALARCGAVMVPSNPLLTVREIAYAATKAEVVAAVTRPDHQAAIRQAVPGLADDKVFVTGTTFPALLEGDEFSGASVQDTDVVEMIFTSGTTAAPKGVLLTHANCLRSGEQVAKSLYLTPDDCCLSALPAFHVNAQSSTILPALSVGARFVLLESYRASQYLHKLAEHAATVTSLVGTQVRTLLRQPVSPADRAHHVRHVFYAINVLDAEYREFERRFGMKLLNGYGLSEAMTAVTIAPIFGNDGWPSVGLPLIDREVRIVGADGNEASTGEIGEITVRGVPGRSIMKGYFKDEAATRAALRDGWLYTGDSGYVDEKGYVYFVDRKKDMIKRSGENVSASEIEAVLLEHPGVAEAAVIGVPDEVRDEAIVAYVVARDGEVLTAGEILEFCSSRLASFKLPSRVELPASLPKTSIGKIEKKALRAEAGQRLESAGR